MFPIYKPGAYEKQNYTTFETKFSNSLDKKYSIIYFVKKREKY